MQVGSPADVLDPFDGSINGTFQNRMQPDGLFYMQNDIYSAWLSAVYMSDAIARLHSSSMGTLMIHHTFPVTSDPTWIIPICTIQDFIDDKWKHCVVPDELSWYVGLDFQEISGDPSHPSIDTLIGTLSEDGETGWAAMDQSQVLALLTETNGYLNPLMWSGCMYDKAYQSWMQRPRQRWIGQDNSVIWSYNPASTKLPALFQQNALSWAKPYSGFINPVCNWASTPHATGQSGSVGNQTHFTGGLPVAINGITNSLDFMLHLHGDHSLATGPSSNATRIHVGDPVELSEYHHPRASWASHVHKCMEPITGSDWEDRYGVNRVGLIGAGWMGHAEFYWQTLGAEAGFVEQFLTYDDPSGKQSSGTPTDSNAVMLIEYAQDQLGIGWMIPSLQFHELLPQVSGPMANATMNYIPAKKEMSFSTIANFASGGHPVVVNGQEVLKLQTLESRGTDTLQTWGNDYDLDTPSVTIADELVNSGSVDHAFGLFVPWAIDSQSLVKQMYLQPYAEPTWVNVGTKGSSYAFNLNPNGKGHVIQLPSSIGSGSYLNEFGDPTLDNKRWTAFRQFVDSGGSGILTALHSPALPSNSGYLSGLDISLLGKHQYDGVVYSITSGTIINYMSLEGLTDVGRFTTVGAPDAFDDTSTTTSGWTLSQHKDFVLLIDEWTGALNIYLPEAEGYDDGLVFSELDNRLVKTAPEILDSVLVQRGCLTLAVPFTKHGLIISSGERVIKPEEEGFDFEELYNIANNLFGGLL